MNGDKGEILDFEGLIVDDDEIYLRAPRPGDHEGWARVREESRDFLQPWEPTWPPDDLDRAAFHRRLRAWRSQARKRTGYSFFIFRRADNAFLGGCRIFEIRPGPRVASVAYWIGVRYARHGYMSAAMAQVGNFAFQRAELHRLEATCEPENQASRRLLLKLGYHEEGCVRGFRYLRGEWRDMILCGLLPDDARFSTGRQDLRGADAIR